jgi:hypothetical protein
MYHRGRVSDRKMAANDLLSVIDLVHLCSRTKELCTARMPILAVLGMTASSSCWILSFQVLHPDLTFDAVGACYVSQGSRVSDRKNGSQ